MILTLPIDRPMPLPSPERCQALLGILRAADGATVSFRALALAIYDIDSPSTRHRLHLLVNYLRHRRTDEGARIETCTSRGAGVDRAGYRLRRQDEGPLVPAALLRITPCCWHPDGPCGEYTRGGCQHCEDQVDGIVCPLRHRPEELFMRTY